MKTTKVHCDSCKSPITFDHYIVTYGMIECVVRSADLCKECKDRFEAALGVKWDELPRETQR